MKVTQLIRLSLLIALLCACATLHAQQDDQTPTYKSEVKLVNVFTTVVDKNGAPVADLRKEDFELLEDNHPEKIAVFTRESELPLSISLGIDTSLSTKKDLPLEVESARRFVHSIVRPIDAVALYQFSSYVDQLTPYTADLRRVDQAVQRMRPGTATAMYDYIYLAAESLMSRKGRKVIVLITDGGDTVSKVNFQEALRAAQMAEAIIYSIIIVPIESSAGRDIGGEHALIEMSRSTGGKSYYASNINALDRAFKQISDELRTQYLIAYYPSRRLADSSYRRIEVIVKDHPDLDARHRAGYYTNSFK